MSQDITADDPSPELDYQRLFNATPSPLLVLDAHLVIVAVNEAYLAATATDRDTLRVIHTVANCFSLGVPP
jgi:PAS domain-containing protein